MMQHLQAWLSMAVLLVPLGASCLGPAPSEAPCPMAGCHESVQAACCCAERQAPASESREDRSAAGPRVAALPPPPGQPPAGPQQGIARGPRVLLPPAASPIPLYLLHASFLI